MPAAIDHRASGMTRSFKTWLLPGSSPERRFAAVALNLGLLLLAVAGLVLLAPASDWSDPILIAALAGISASPTPLRRG